jgi:hypothetical protein
LSAAPAPNRQVLLLTLNTDNVVGYVTNVLRNQALAMSLEPGDLRKGHTITSPGKAHFFAPKVNQCFQSRFTCQYSSTWHGGVRGFLQWKPSEIQIGDCQPVQ